MTAAPQIDLAPPAMRQPRPYRFAYLLATELALILIGPQLADDRPRPALAVPYLALFAAAIWAVADDRRTRSFAVGFAAPAIVLHLVSAATGSTRVFVTGIASAVALLVFVTAVIFREVVTSREVTRGTLFGAVAGYVLLGVTWAWTYGLVEYTVPGSFHSFAKPEGVVIPPDFLFFSFVTLTSVGYGDIVPVGELARSLSVLEMITGVMFQAIFMARLVGLYAPGAKAA